MTASRRPPEGRQRQQSDERQRTEQSTDESADDEELQPDDLDADELTRTAEGELIHEETGLIVEEDQIDHGPEWRAFDHSERQSKSRVGSPMTQTMHDKGLTTNIDWQDKDARGNQLSAERRSQMERLRTWQERIRSQDAGERNLKLALSEIDRMASASGVPDSVREVAAVIYRRALDEDLIRGRSIEGVSTAALHAACRQEGIPRSLDEITRVSRVERREIGRAYRYISGELGLELQPVDPQQYLPRFASDLEIEPRTQRKAEEILDETTSEGLHAGKSPTGFAGAAVYLAGMLCNDKRTQEDVAEVADVTVVTIRNRYKEQLKSVGHPT
ncbi:transcription initiation factor IIB [Halorubrum gandharaense]